MGLVTLAYAQSRLPGVPADTLTKLIEAASARFEGEIGRTLAAADYRETVSPFEGTALVSRYPVIRVDRVSSTPAVALRIANPGAARPRASVEAARPGTEAPASLRLAAFGVPTATVAIADGWTFAALAAAVVAVGGGWTAEVEGGRGDSPANDLLLGTYAAGQGWAALKADTRERSSRFDSAEDADAGILQVEACAQVRVWYRAGFEQIPADVQEAVVAMIAASLDPTQAGGTGIKRRKLGDREVEFFGAADLVAFPKSVRGVINLYRDRRI